MRDSERFRAHGHQGRSKAFGVRWLFFRVLQLRLYYGRKSDDKRSLYSQGSAMMAVWFTDCTLSLTTTWVRIMASVAWACENVASDLGLGGGFRRVLWFPPLLTTG